MSLRDLRRHAGQLALLGFAGHEIPPELKSIAREFDIGGVIFFARNIAEPRQVLELAREARALARAGRAYPIREEHEFYLSNAPFALLRYTLLEVGRRMAGRGQLDQAEDILFLELDEAQAAFRARSDFGRWSSTTLFPEVSRRLAATVRSRIATLRTHRADHGRRAAGIQSPGFCS